MGKKLSKILVLVVAPAALIVWITYEWAQSTLDNGPTAASLTLSVLLILAPILVVIVGAAVGAYRKLAAEDRNRQRLRSGR